MWTLILALFGIIWRLDIKAQRDTGRYRLLRLWRQFIDFQLSLWVVS
jgi:hypothetical protein